ncbi:MAG: hypothetical protein QXH10_08920 [Ignisphaera sp.]|uniref:Uncharacterized protein n=1 Tax=Ignisphaera aggregans TaxID=334771 RepID=A0A7C4NK80_9CREN
MKNIHNRVIFVVISILLVTCSTISITAICVDDLYREFLDLYVEVAKLAQQGIDVSNLVEKLMEAHEALTNGRSFNLSVIKAEIDNIKRDAPKIILYKNIVKGFSVGGLISIPILIYLFLPRVYLYIWYKSRRRWVVKVESS